MSKTSEVLNNTLEAVNKNNAITISFCNREKIIIKTMMEQYAKACCIASLEKASRIAKTFKSGNSGSYLDASIDKLSITQESNIVLL